MISINRPACGTFQENKYTEKLTLNPKFIEYKGVNNPDIISFPAFNKINITNFQNVLIFAEKFDIIKPTGENNDFNV